MAAHSGRLLTDAVVATLSNAGILVDAGEKPAGGGWQGSPGASTFEAYTIVWPTPGGFSTGDIEVPFDDVRPDYVITSYGSTTRQAEFGSDEVRDALTAPGAITVSGRSILLVAPDVEPGAIPDYDVTPVTFFSPARWRILTTAA